MLSNDVISIYKSIRQDHVAFYAGNGKNYHHKVTAAQALVSARYQAKI